MKFSCNINKLRKTKLRFGRGPSGRRGKNCGRGIAGSGSRAGYSLKPTFEGGQFPFVRKIPKRGFTNIFRKTFVKGVNLQHYFDKINQIETYIITKEELLNLGVIKKKDLNYKVYIKFLGDQQLKEKIKNKFQLEGRIIC